jgi:hypothetical protein
MYPIPPLRFARGCAGPRRSLTRLHVLSCMALFCPAPGLGAQESATVRVEENLRAEPNGQVVGRVLPGSRMVVEGRQDRWLEVTLEGWVWLPSLQRRSGGSFDLSVSADGGENLREEPRGRVAARLGRGTLLEEVERTTGWIRVRRTAWIWGPSVQVTSPTPAAAAVRPAAPVPPPVSRWIRGGPGGSSILSAPGGDTLARSAPGAELRMVGREGNWVRVQLDGWVWAPEGAGGEGASDGVTDVTPEQVAADPARFRGRVVSWSVQFIALERAERVRTDFFEGEPYLLTRAGTSEGSFVYVAVPQERLAEVQGLTPLERVQVVGRIRTGSAGLTGSPIVDLLEVRRIAR